MAKAKPKNPGTVPICINIPRKLMKALDKRLADLRAKEEYAYISRSAFLSHALAEWTMILDNPAYEPAPAQEVRRRLRPEPRQVANPANGKLTPARVRRIRRDKRPLRYIARDLGVSPSAVSRVKNGQTWRWVE